MKFVLLDDGSELLCCLLLISFVVEAVVFDTWLHRFQLFTENKPGPLKSSSPFPINFQPACLPPVVESLHLYSLTICR